MAQLVESVLVEVRPRSCGKVGANWRKFWLLVCPSRLVALFPFGRKRIQLSHPAVNLPSVELHLLDPPNLTSRSLQII